MLVADFHKYILPEVVGCPDPLLDQMIVLSAYEFCDLSGAWNEVQDEIAVTAGDAEYTITSPAQSIPLRIRDLWINDTRVTQEQMRNLPSVSLGTPTTFNSAEGFGVVTISPTPSVDMRLRMRVVYAPSLSATDLPTDLFSRYADAIASGAKSRVMMLKDWQNPSLSQFYRSEFLKRVHDAQIESIHDRVSGSLTIVPRRFA